MAAVVARDIETRQLDYQSHCIWMIDWRMPHRCYPRSLFVLFCKQDSIVMSSRIDSPIKKSLRQSPHICT